MGLFEDVFNKTSIYDMLFFNIKSVLEFPTLETLKENNEPMYNRWCYLAKRKHNFDMTANIGYNQDEANELYRNEAIYYPEFSRIVAITYANLYVEDGTVKRDFKKIVNADESVVVESFIRELRELSTNAQQSTPNYFPILVGHNIVGYDIPLLIKRYVYLTNDNQSSEDVIPLILKKAIMAKPWESGVIDTTNVWKFNGNSNMPLMLIADFLGLKKVVDVMPLNDLSKYFWKNVGENQKETIEQVALQSATQTNLVIQLMNKLRRY